MATNYGYACKEFPGMETCPAHIHAETEGELWKLIELHASLAHGRMPANGQPRTSPSSRRSSGLNRAVPQKSA